MTKEPKKFVKRVEWVKRELELSAPFLPMSGSFFVLIVLLKFFVEGLIVSYKEGKLIIDLILLSLGVIFLTIDFFKNKYKRKVWWEPKVA